MSSTITIAGKKAMLDAIAAHDWRAALYTSGAKLDETTEVYDTLNEVPDGSGYEAGGLALSATTGSDDYSGMAWLDFADAVWMNASFTSRYMLIYDASDSGRAYVLIDFGGDKTGQGGNFRFRFPLGDADNALIRL
jgi:hypothetical protein